jgi:hypothetical protein
MKFGVREIVDVVFKATANGQKLGTKTFSKYQPVFKIDTATTSSLEQATTTVYAQGGKGYARLIAWEGEKTMTFTVTDALMSPMGLAVLTGAGLINPGQDGAKQAHVHTTVNVAVDSEGHAKVSVDDLNEEFGLDAKDYAICNTIEMFATELDGSGAGINWFSGVTITDPAPVENDYVVIDKTTANKAATFNIPGAKDTTVQLDFYVIMNNSVTEVQIEPGSFGGYFYVEAQTLFRREDTGKDMAAEIIIPKAKIQSAFTFTMAASGDPSTFDFVMDAMPGYTRFDSTKKQMCVIQIIGDDKKAVGEAGSHEHNAEVTEDSPSFHRTDSPVTPDPVLTTLSVTGAKVPSTDVDQSESQANQDEITVTSNDNTINIATDVEGLEDFTTTDGTHKWIGLTIDTGVASLTEVELDGETVSATAGKFTLWLDAESTFPKTYVIAAEGYADTTITITLNA